MTDIYCEKGTHLSFEDYMALINRAFGFTQPEQRFEGLLPKLYAPERRPQDSNYIVTENGMPVAAVGAYDHEITVCGMRIPCRGIGNVAVDSAARGKGYMKACMNAALSDMVKDGIALSTLGGRRQRYQYFSYDKAGPCITFSINPDNLRHTYGTLNPPFDTFAQVTREDVSLIGKIKALADAGDFVAVRAHEDWVDIAETWRGKLYAVCHRGDFKGYCILEPNGLISEIKSVAHEDLMPLIRTICAGNGFQCLSLRLPDFEASYISELAPVAEEGHLGCSMSYSVLNYALVTEAFLKLKATYAALPDGALSVLIHGYGGDERLRLCVQGGEVTVAKLPDSAPVDCAWSHLEACNLMFAPISPERKHLPDMAQRWFPLPLWIYRADEV